MSDLPGSPPRVAYLVSQYPAFSHAFITNEIEALQAQGWDVHTFSLTKPSLGDPLGWRATFVIQDRIVRQALLAMAFLATKPGIALRGLREVRHVAKRHTSKSFRTAARQVAYFYEAAILTRELNRRGLGHVHVHFANSAADVARLASRMSGVGNGEGRRTWSMTVHGPADFERAREVDLRGKSREVDALFCISEFARGQMSATVATQDRDRAVVCRMGVSVATLDTPSDSSRSMRTTSMVRILFVGRLVAKKDPVGLVRAVAALADRKDYTGRHIELTVVGSGPERAALSSLSDQLPTNVTLLLPGAATHEQVLKHYSRSDIFCLPSFSEGLPVVLMEALAARLAVIATPIAAVPELIVDGVTGLLVTPGDTAALAAALDRLITAPALRRQLGARGRAVVESNFVSSGSARILSETFITLLNSDASVASKR